MPWGCSLLLFDVRHAIRHGQMNNETVFAQKCKTFMPAHVVPL
jgi:hypothetical protein